MLIKPDSDPDPYVIKPDLALIRIRIKEKGLIQSGPHHVLRIRIIARKNMFNKIC
jgi:hypothetical protein